MKQSNSSWSIGRFWQTLNYFDVIPGLNFWKNIFKSKNQNYKINNVVMKNILLVNSCNNIAQRVIGNLNSQKYKVKLLNLEHQLKNQDELSEVVKSWTLESYAQDNLNANIFENVEQIIYFTKIPEKNESNLANLLEFITNNCNNTSLKNIFDFTNYDSSIKELWGAVDDVVMGGVSESQIQLINNKAVFSGNVSTNNNGGFASVRTRNFYPVMNLANYEGIELKVRGDGQRYKFIMRCEGTWDGIGYCYSFDTVKDNWQTIRIPFADLIPVFRAKTVKEADTFNSNQVYSMQLMLSKFEYDGGLNPAFEPGYFKLEVEYIKAYSNNHQYHFILVSDCDSLEIDSETLNEQLQQENMVRRLGSNYNIVRSYEIPEYIADKVFYLSEPNNKLNQNKEKLMAEICLKIIQSALEVNKTFEVQDYKAA